MTKGKKGKHDLAAQLRELVGRSGKPAYRVAEESGVPQGVLSRFLNGSGLAIQNVEKLARYFGLELRPRDKE
jgi:hypothetical protein